MAWTEFVDEAKRRGACDEWLGVLRNMHDRLSDEQLWTLAQQCPWKALLHCSERLTDEQIKQLREMV